MPQGSYFLSSFVQGQTRLGLSEKERGGVSERADVWRPKKESLAVWLPCPFPLSFFSWPVFPDSVWVDWVITSKSYNHKWLETNLIGLLIPVQKGCVDSEPRDQNYSMVSHMFFDKTGNPGWSISVLLLLLSGTQSTSRSSSRARACATMHKMPFPTSGLDKLPT